MSHTEKLSSSSTNIENLFFDAWWNPFRLMSPRKIDKERLLFWPAREIFAIPEKKSRECRVQMWRLLFNPFSSEQNNFDFGLRVFFSFFLAFGPPSRSSVQQSLRDIGMQRKKRGNQNTPPRKKGLTPEGKQKEFDFQEIFRTEEWFYYKAGNWRMTVSRIKESPFWQNSELREKRRRRSFAAFVFGPFSFVFPSLPPLPISPSFSFPLIHFPTLYSAPGRGEGRKKRNENPPPEK